MEQETCFASRSPPRVVLNLFRDYQDLLLAPFSGRFGRWRQQAFIGYPLPYLNPAK